MDSIEPPEADPSFDARIAIDARYLNGEESGIGRYTENTIPELLDLAPRLRLLLITHPNRPEPLDHPRVASRVFPAPANSLRTRLFLGRVLDTSGVDLFHSPFNFLPAGLDIPALFTLHDLMWLLNADWCTHKWWNKIISGTFFKTLIPRSVAESDRILTVSDHSRRSIEERFPSMEGRVDVCYNGVDPFFRPVEPAEGWPLISEFVPPRAPFLLSVGQGAPYKNHAGAAAGFVEAFRDNPDVYFVLVRRRVGKPEPELKRLMEIPGVGSRIIRLEYVSGDQLRALYSLARVFLFPSLYEGFGLPSIEAMACGTPVVTSDRGAMEEVNSPAALCVDPESPREIARACERLVYDDETYRTRRSRCLRHAENFTWRRCAHRMLASYRRTLEEQSETTEAERRRRSGATT